MNQKNRKVGISVVEACGVPTPQVQQVRKKAISIMLPEELHRELKMRSAESGKLLKDLIVEVLERGIRC